MREAGDVANRVLVEKSEKKGPPGRPRHTWEDNIKMDFQEVGWVWPGLIWRTPVNAVMNLQVP